MSAIKKRHMHLTYLEEEPPEKKIKSDGDLLIKKLALKQMNTDINLKQ